MRELLPHVDDERMYVSIARQHIENLENILRDDKRRLIAMEDNPPEQEPGTIESKPASVVTVLADGKTSASPPQDRPEG